MTIEEPSKKRRNLRGMRRPAWGKRQHGVPAKLHLESLEPRQLLAVGPQLVGIAPNDGPVCLIWPVFFAREVQLFGFFDASSAFSPKHVSRGKKGKIR